MTWDDLKKQLGSCGVAYPGTEILIRSTETGKRACPLLPLGRYQLLTLTSTVVRLAAVNVGEEGEILIRGVSCAISYLNNPAATAEAFTADRWFCTGDVGKIDPQGNVWITDRLKELVKVKGFQVSPAELEDSLCASPLVQDAGVTSIYHNDHATEYPRAYVMPFDKEVLKGGKKAHEFAHALRKHIEAKHAPYKWCVPFLTSPPLCRREFQS